MTPQDAESSHCSQDGTACRTSTVAAESQVSPAVFPDLSRPTEELRYVYPLTPSLRLASIRLGWEKVFFSPEIGLFSLGTIFTEPVRADNKLPVCICLPEVQTSPWWQPSPINAHVSPREFFHHSLAGPTHSSGPLLPVIERTVH